MGYATVFNDYLEHHCNFNPIFQNPGQDSTLKRKFMADGFDLFKAAIELKRHLINYDYAHLFGRIVDGSFVTGRLMTKRAKKCASLLFTAPEVDAILTMDSPVVPATQPMVGPVAPVLAAPARIPAPSCATKANTAGANTGFYTSKIKPAYDFIFHNQGQGNLVFHYKIPNVVITSSDIWRKAIARRLICLAIEKIRANKPFKTFVIPEAKYEPVGGVGTEPANMDHPFNNTDWIRYVNEIRMEKPASSFLSGMGDSISDALWKVVPWESDKWSSTESGKIYFAEEKGSSYHFADNGVTAQRSNETRQDAVCKEVKNDLKKL
jgi:hypothetical protein